MFNPFYIQLYIQYIFLELNLKLIYQHVNLQQCIVQY